MDEFGYCFYWSMGGVMDVAMDDSDLVRGMFMAKGFSRNDRGVLVPNSEFEIRNNFVLRVGPIIKEIINSDEILFAVGATRLSPQGIVSTSLGRRLVSRLRGDMFDFFDAYPDHKINPYFNLFFGAIKRHGLIGGAQHISYLRDDNARIFVDVLNACIADIRCRAKSVGFKAQLKSYFRAVAENFKGFTSYVNNLFELHARMLVVRIDLSYLEAFRKGDNDISFKEAGQHRSKLLSALSKSKFGRLLGYAWKFEKGVRKGLHYHLILFFDGSQVWKDVMLARAIGEFWRATITAGKGTYYNCNAFKHRYKYCGIGMVHYTDMNAREGLRRIVIYMTKLDEYFKLSVPGVRAFGKAGPPKEPRSNRGRPRSASK